MQPYSSSIKLQTKIIGYIDTFVKYVEGIVNYPSLQSHW